MRPPAWGCRCISSPGAALGEFPVQSQKRGVSNCFRRPEFCQRGQNSSAGNGVVGSRGRWERPLPVFVRQAARGGRIPASGSSKKHHRFFLWTGNSPKAAPRRRNTAAAPHRRTHSFGYAAGLCWIDRCDKNKLKNVEDIIKFIRVIVRLWEKIRGLYLFCTGKSKFLTKI